MSRGKNNHSQGGEISLSGLLPTFGGGESKDDNINYFLDRLRDIAVLENWSEERKFLVLKLNLKSKALEYVIGNEQAQTAKTFDELAKILKQKFSKTESFKQKQERFTNIKQKPKQKVRELAEKIKKITIAYIDFKDRDNEEFKKLHEKLAFTKFIEALRPDIKIEVKKLGPENFEQAIKIAENVEGAYEEQSDEIDIPKIVENLEVNHLVESQMKSNLEIEKLKRELQELKNERLQNRNRITCHICAKNHLTTDCWNYPKNQVQPSQNNRVFRGYNSGFRGNRYNRGENRRNFQTFRPYNRNFSRNNTNNLN
jgi:hypothetical protein